ncbi:preprotein translocase subunit SecE [Parasphaerochaeta coccoides]|uniref:Protein translocase subunit SecE n=1 Tax=Parasphaerochaeta coccoides (strain ATCC BAA-1237 / DSM 17374 / SPN1) TaxID=760011 RepID=F4GL94_PARC1|nr:preprotein translocase subunit SecE [Parasphaerochaeta coccoides]AEC02926.1 preprotein translocase, SecE subunit [Parasphaerochaeta coccoides DSM 17374]
MKKLIAYFKESRQEMKKVVWPGRDTVVASTKVVLVATVAAALFLGVIDFLLLQGLYLIF